LILGAIHMLRLKGVRESVTRTYFAFKTPVFNAFGSILKVLLYIKIRLGVG